MLYEPLIDTDKKKRGNISKSIVFAGFGTYLLCYGFYSVYNHETVTTVIAAFVMGAFLLFASNFRKRYFIAQDGIVETVSSWSGRKHTLMPWNELSLISFVSEGENLTVYFDNGKKVCKLEFDSWQRKDIKQLVHKYAANVDINEIRK